MRVPFWDPNRNENPTVAMGELGWNEAIEHAFSAQPPDANMIARTLRDCFRSRNYEEIIVATRNIFADLAYQKLGREDDEREFFASVAKILEVNPHTADGAILITECCNWAAKSIEYKFYMLKPYAIVAAWKMGANFGRGEDGAYYLNTKAVGTASFHDPGGEIEYLVTHVLGEKVPVWRHPWSGVTRQEEAFDIAADYVDRAGALPRIVSSTSVPIGGAHSSGAYPS